jgi:diaminohydroxyphosphoribosylaminopyrimidine deaminase/5-amino-6-(5-phosphoribosylamino)uracil reductase
LNDETYIRQCIDLAKKGIGNVSPNPLVGCVIVKDEKLLGYGYHQFYGGNHAEVNAILSTSEPLSGATLYVNLEPCSHYGKTPPCVDKIIRSGIKRVVVGTLDPNPLVAGKGVKALKKAGVDVTVGVLEDECIDLNKFFFKFIQTGFPYINLKIAQSLDGFIADKFYNSKWITSEKSRKIVHSMRAEYDAVLVGVNTANIDKPNLDVRLVEGRNPYRVILDDELKINSNLSLIKNNGDRKTIVVTSYKSFNQQKSKVNFLESNGVQVLKVRKSKSNLELLDVLEKLANSGISSVLIEGGSQVFTSFYRQNLWDEINLFIAPFFLGNGISTFSKSYSAKVNDVEKFRNITIEQVEKDIRVIISKSFN